MSKVILKGYILVAPSDLLAVSTELPNHIELTRKEDGCTVFDVTQDQENPNRFNVHEEFSSKQAFAYHQERVRKSKWGAVTVNVKRHYDLELLN